MNYGNAILCLILTGIMLPVTLLADYQAGVAAYQRGDFGHALEEWQSVIESAPADVHPRERSETLYAVAMLFWLGQGVEQDTATAAGFLRQAAELNHAGAQSKLGYLYLIGQGVPASTFEAGKWLEMAARQGDVDAQYNLAVMYRDGMGITPDPEKALQWFEEAAANGDPVSAEVITEYGRHGALQAAEVGMNALAGKEPETESGLEQPETGNGQASTADTSADSRLGAVEEIESDAAGFDPSTAEPKTESAASKARDEAWVLEQDETHYTIQVIALKNVQSMNQLIAMHPQMEPFAIYLQGDFERPLYVLVQGNYATLDDAQIAKQKFPASLAKPEQLWIRRFSMVQNLIRQRHLEEPPPGGSEHGTN